VASQGTWSAARLAALIAVPVAVLAGFGLFIVLTNVLDPPPAAPPSPPPDPPSAVATGPVTTQARELDEREETVCRAVLSQLPAEVGGLAQRPVTAGAEQNAAYGEPPLTLACGGLETGYRPTDTVYPLPGGVCWHLAEGEGQSVWTSLDREVPVRVSVPASYDGAGQLVTALTSTIARTIRTADDLPPGCETAG
jgi:hypothetical protein